MKIKPGMRGAWVPAGRPRSSSVLLTGALTHQGPAWHRLGMATRHPSAPTAHSFLSFLCSEMELTQGIFGSALLILPRKCSLQDILSLALLGCPAMGLFLLTYHHHQIWGNYQNYNFLQVFQVQFSSSLTRTPVYLQAPPFLQV